MNKFNRKHIGEMWSTKAGYTAEIIDGAPKRGFCTIQIGTWTSIKQYTQIQLGVIKYPYHPLVVGKGYFGEGPYSFKRDKRIYNSWYNMLKRCYDPSTQEQHSSYIGVTVDTSWFNFQAFAKWYSENYREGWHLDKDLLAVGEDKVYSPTTCIFLPRSLNSFLTRDRYTNSSGERGVSRASRGAGWTVSFSCKYLGSFNTKEEASEVYQKARAEQAAIWKEKMQGILPQEAIRNIK